MTIDYARAYTHERLARANNKRIAQEAIRTHKATRTATRSIRAVVGGPLVGIGDRLLRGHPQRYSQDAEPARR